MMKSSRLSTLIWSISVFLLTGCASLPGASPASGARLAADYRIYDTSADAFIDMAALSDRLGAADVVFFGEVHNDSVTHLVEHELLRWLARDTTWSVLGLEMFERDVQPVLEAYSTGNIDEATFLARARPWPNYATDYRPLVEAAQVAGWHVVGTNLPQVLASAVARQGIETLRSLDLETRRMAAAAVECPEDEYWRRFLDAMTESSQADSTVHMEGVPTLRRTYEAQCLRDETMAETIAALLPTGRVYHVNGAFHTDFHLGIVPRLLRRAPDTAVTVLSAIAVDDLANPPLSEHAERADFLVFTRSPDL